MPRRLSLLLPLGLALSLTHALAGCDGCAAPAVTPDGGDPAADGGRGDAGRIDAGDDAFLPPWPDAGQTFKTGSADVPCPEESAAFVDGFLDGGLPDGALFRGLCIGLSQLDGVATVDGLPVAAPIHLKVDDLTHGSALELSADPNGLYSLRFMKGRYDRLQLHPTQLGAHTGHKSFGFVDLRKDQTRNLAVKTWVVGGSALFAGQPWPSTNNPPDVALHAEGLPAQTAWTSNELGAWHVRLMEGEFQFRISVPYQSLGETQLTRYPVGPWTNLVADRTLDIDIPSAELSGHLTLDGQPFPDRVPNGPDFRLEYGDTAGGDSVAESTHEGGTSHFAAVVPRGGYTVTMTLAEAVDSSLPSALIGKQLAPLVDLSHGNATLAVDLKTHGLEGALLIDGEPVQPQPNNTWVLYASARAQAADPGFLAYYQVPLTHPSFKLRALEGRYLLALLLGSSLHPELAQGWFIVENDLLVDRDLPLPIDVPTRAVEGILRIDGTLAASEHGSVGRLSFRAPNGQRFTWEVHTQDGRFRVRLPRAVYDVEFEINADAYPDHATGRHPLGVVVDLADLTGVSNPSEEPVQVSLDYRTLAVGGPLLFGGEALPDAMPGFSEARLHLQRSGKPIRFVKRLDGGVPVWFMRIPAGHYTLAFELEEGVLSDVASGTAALGNALRLE